MFKKLAQKIKVSVPLLLILTAIFGTIYIVAQQSYRQSANDPQIQMAEDQAKNFEAGQKVESINNLPKIDPSQSLNPFLIVFDSQGNPLVSTAILNGRIPVPPHGVFESVNSQGEDRITWQPAENVRIAAVITAFHGPNPGYVLAGRSLREVEKREQQLNLQIGAGYTVSLMVIFASLLLIF